MPKSCHSPSPPRSEIFRFLYLKNAKVGLRMKVEILKISNFPGQILIFLLLVLKILNFWVDFQSIFLNSALKKTCFALVFLKNTFFLNTKFFFCSENCIFLCFQRIDRRKLIRKSTFKNFLPLSKVGFMSDLVSQNESICRSQHPAAKQPGVTREGQFFSNFFFMKVPKSPETDENNIFSRNKFFFWFSKKTYL